MIKTLFKKAKKTFTGRVIAPVALIGTMALSMIGCAPMQYADGSYIDPNWSTAEKIRAMQSQDDYGNGYDGSGRETYANGMVVRHPADEGPDIVARTLGNVTGGRVLEGGDRVEVDGQFEAGETRGLIQRKRGPFYRIVR